MQLRALIKTRKRKWAILLLAFAVFGVAMCVLLGGGRKLSDEEKFQQMVRSEKRGINFQNLRLRHRFPAPLRKALGRLEKMSFQQRHRQQVELVASGYLVEIYPTKWNFDAYKLMNQVKATSYWSLSVKSNVTVATCLSNDAARIRAALEKKP